MDDFLASNGGGSGKDGYSFTMQTGPSPTGYGVLTAPLSLNSTGTRAFCSDETGVLYYNSGSATCDAGTGTPLQ